MFYTFASLEACSVVNLVESLETINHDLQEVAPTIHFAVPRVWEKQYSTVAIKLKDATSLERFAYRVALAVGTKTAEFRKRGQRVPVLWKTLFFVADSLVLRNLKRLLGIDGFRCLLRGLLGFARLLRVHRLGLGRLQLGGECHGHRGQRPDRCYWHVYHSEAHGFARH